MRPNNLWIAAVALLFAALAAVVFRQAWMGDDAYITLRSVENWIGGYGLVWNAGERVQTFTHPLWMLLLAAGRVVTGEAYYTTLVLSSGFSLAAVLVLLRIGRTVQAAAVLLVLLLCSRSFTEYVTGGLENPLTFALIAGFAWTVQSSLSPLRKVALAALLTGLAMTTRMDLAALLGVPLLALAWSGAKSGPSGARAWLQVGWRLVVGMTPFLVWELFATIYYGSPFPITAHAKAFDTGIPAADIAVQGLHYWYYVLTRDLLTSVVILAGIAVGCGRKELGCRALAIGALLYCIYITKVGGDFMAGRFATVPFFASMTILARWFSTRPLVNPAQYALPIGAALALLLLTPTTFPNWPDWPKWMRSPAEDQPPSELHEVHKGIVDERCFYYRDLGLLSPQVSIPQPGTMSRLLRDKFGRDEPVVAPWGMIGRYGFEAGPQVHLIDSWLCDPLLMRLPIGKPDWRIGHIVRYIPEGYFETLSSGENRFHHPGLGRYYDALRTMLRAPVFDGERWKVMLGLWRGDYDEYLQSYIDEEYYNPPRLVVDGEELASLPPALPLVWWEDYPQSSVIYRGGIEVRYDKPQTGTRVVASVADNQKYVLRFRRDGKEVGEVSLRNTVLLIRGNQVHSAELPHDMGPFDSIWIDVPTWRSWKFACVSGLVIEP